uniref:DnaJ domain-containing protein n=1 Tax=Candidatus Kentrum sp. TUN TaxID=2126343 RepID=A0A450ZGL0_9GAMM|nr:MAG: DnaJ domain-containing protein [Candidatus Kentron sp. TUN]VFK53455.1 MAG: DnaJ domain-containing protein [Candidatus Kentron sp. TUN]VFK55188.1 MAG: DnaJ domain-containing protein [Candidatus Kentron sp. TUN]
MHLILWLVALFGLALFFSWLNRMPQATRSQLTSRILLIVGIGLGGILIIRGLHPLLAAVGAFLPLLPRLINALKAIKTLQFLRKLIRGLGQEKTSNVETHWIDARLSRSSNEIEEGEVLAGRYQGKLLTQLTLEQLLYVLTECHKQQDKYSATILEKYLDRRYSGIWRDRYNNPNKEKESLTETKTMTIADAYEILGIPFGSDKKAITAAYRRLMQKLHPDRGGSTLLAIQINRAKNILLDFLSRKKE